MPWNERDSGWKYTARYRSNNGTNLSILMCPLTGHDVELTGDINGRYVSETFEKYRALNDFLRRRGIERPVGYRTAWKSQH